MPGSKTYTSNKINELLEQEFLYSISEMEKHSVQKLSNTFFFEVMKICLSLLISAVVKYFHLEEVQTSAAGQPGEMETIVLIIIAFTLSYLLIHLLGLVLRWLFYAAVNKRILLSVKRKAYAEFHKKIINHIYLAISFENKYNTYVSQGSCQENNLNFDLAANYLSQAVHYFKLANDELHELIPPEAKRDSYLEKKNAEYLDYIGFPIVNIALISGERSLLRLLSTEDNIIKTAGSISSKINQHHIQHGYSSSLKFLFGDIKSYVACYQSFLERVADLQKLRKTT